MKLLVATTNKGKVLEFRQMLGGLGLEFDDLSTHPGVAAPDETGETFRENACLKAAYYATNLRAWTLADDSGLCVDALGGKPGVHSARWAEMHAAGRGDADNNALLLKQLERSDDDGRSARFWCALAMSDPRGRTVLTAMDSLEGTILRQPRGPNGFGYDPLFLVADLGKTTAELEPEQKHAISHRGKALRRMHGMMGRLNFAELQND